MIDRSAGCVRAFACVFGVSILALMTGPALAKRLTNWSTLQSQSMGFSIAYPGNIFVQDVEKSRDDGFLLVSIDGRAKLLVGAFVNEDKTTLRDYRQFVMDESYKGGVLDHAPMKGKYFVLSGERNGTMFYERVSFTCGGSLINSWAMTYPVAERGLYDKVVEAVGRTYSPGAGREGGCDFGST